MRALRMRHALREPLLQFLVAGVLLFAAYRLLHPEQLPDAESNRIELTTDDIRQLEIAWTAQWQRPPTQEDLRGLVDGRVREEILYREALALGLDRGDTIIKRRLAQKMEFLADDSSSVPEPSAGELRAWYAQNSARFEEPGRRSFRHVYFSTDRRGARASDDAAQALGRFGATPDNSSRLSSAGDPFMFQAYYADCTPEEVAKIFGSEFADKLRQLPVGSWQGPIESGLGWHLVIVTSATPGRIPAFEEIEADIKAGWLEDQRMAARRRAFEAMSAHYDVHLPDVTQIATVGHRPAPKATP